MRVPKEECADVQLDSLEVARLMKLIEKKWVKEGYVPEQEEEITFKQMKLFVELYHTNPSLEFLQFLANTTISFDNLLCCGEALQLQIDNLWRDPGSSSICGRMEIRKNVRGEITILHMNPAPTPQQCYTRGIVLIVPAQTFQGWHYVGATFPLD
ncbi:hypothetical protein M427DRAFT_139132 [Gonapodya prolifera JEL478]|uniref:Uncharacterized protein n=1 Tax=Gonapodya prolifera (strain JEL478) TaxID=1344416 RepID=A0A139A2S3_GONPJ|nr:hypothetical protein M427DRAFT_139132 [Gonapodya prolifera JEL478]|eukprot:KXS10653.1 hypothetical protein M427DRAFT_139132 [Gonapodya prolifera JEL478]